MILPKQTVSEPQVTFRELAPEIRNTIYKFSLMEPEGMVYLAQQPSNAYSSRRKLLRGVRDGGFGNWGFTMPDRSTMQRGSSRNTALLRTSKAVYKEAAGLVYGQTFGFFHLGALQAFLIPLSDTAFAFLRRVEVRVADAEWDLLPGMSLQLAHLESLKLGGIYGRFHGTPTMFTKYLNATARYLYTWDVTLENFDILTGIKIARDLYTYAYPLIQQMVEHGGQEGVQKLLGMLDLYNNPHVHLDGFRQVRDRFGSFSSGTIPWSDDRSQTVRVAVGEEMVKMVEEDK